MPTLEEQMLTNVEEGIGTPMSREQLLGQRSASQEYISPRCGRSLEGLPGALPDVQDSNDKAVSRPSSPQHDAEREQPNVTTIHTVNSKGHTYPPHPNASSSNNGGNNHQPQSAMPKVDHASGDTADTHTKPETDILSGWQGAKARFEKKDKAMMDEYNDEINSLLIFAGLFLAVLTAFIIDVWKTLEEDYTETSAVLLRRISLQMANISDESVSIPPVFQASGVAKAINVFWFSSLMISIFAALFGIFVKQWLHTYSNWSDVGNPKEAVLLRSVYYDSLFAWHISELLSVLPLLLQLALVFFIVGLVAYLWTLDIIVAAFASVLALVDAAAVLAVVLLPLRYEDCAYKSPFALFILRWRRPMPHSNWRLYDLDRATKAQSNDPKDNPCLRVSHEIERLLGITPSDGGESLSDSTLVFTRVNELESSADTSPFQLLQALLVQASKTPPVPYEHIPQSLLGIVEVLSALTRCERYKPEPQVAAGIVAHVCQWAPQFPTKKDVAEKFLSRVQILHNSLLRCFGAKHRARLRDAGFDMLVQSLDQWTTLIRLQTEYLDKPQGIDPLIDDMANTRSNMQDESDTLLQPVTLAHTTSINAIARSSDGGYIATALSNGQIVVWHAQSHCEIMVLKNNITSVVSVAFSPDCKYIASAAANNSVYIWDVTTGTITHTLQGHIKVVNSCLFSANGTHIVSGSEDRTVRVWNLTDAAPWASSAQLVGHTRDVNSVACSQDGLYIISGSDDRTIRLWDAKTLQHVRTLEGHTGAVTSVATSYDNRWIVSGSRDKSIRLWDVETGAHLRNLQGHSSNVLSVQFSPQGTYIASSSSDNTVRVWDVHSGTELRTLKGHTRPVDALAFSPDGRYIVSGSRDRDMKMWDSHCALGLIRLQKCTDAWHLTNFSCDGTYVVFTNAENARVWNTHTGSVVSNVQGHTADILCASFSYQGTHLVTGSEDKIARIWNVGTGECLNTLSGHTGSVQAVCFSRNGVLVASGSNDRAIRIWDVAEGNLVYVLEGHTSWVLSVAFSGSGSHIVSGSCDCTVRVWSTRTRQAVQMDGHDDFVRLVAFSPNEGQILSGSYDHTVRVWDTDTGRMLATLRHDNYVESVAFSSDGTYITAVDRHNVARTWSAPHDFPLDTRISERPLTPAAPIFTFERESGWILGRRDTQGTPEPLFWVIPQLRPKSRGRIWTCGHKVMFRTESGAMTVLNFDCHI